MGAAGKGATMEIIGTNELFELMNRDELTVIADKILGSKEKYIRFTKRGTSYRYLNPLWVEPKRVYNPIPKPKYSAPKPVKPKAEDIPQVERIGIILF